MSADTEKWEQTTLLYPEAVLPVLPRHVEKTFVFVLHFLLLKIEKGTVMISFITLLNQRQLISAVNQPIDKRKR